MRLFGKETDVSPPSPLAPYEDRARAWAEEKNREHERAVARIIGEAQLRTYRRQGDGDADPRR